MAQDASQRALDEVCALMRAASPRTARGVWREESRRRGRQERRFSFRAPQQWRVELDGALRVVSDGVRSASPDGDTWYWVPADRAHHSVGLWMMLFPDAAPLWGRPGDLYRPARILPSSPDRPSLVTVRFDPMETAEPVPLTVEVDEASGVVRTWSSPAGRQWFDALELNVELPEAQFEVPAAALPDPSFT
ncbi:hypothetical protein GTY65_38500 [Streptomyces sp. SID8379]|uniref:hypothetical protein n=1 Tax=unclassified Streptomyces TaxID=2593676 RepID=UPI000399AC72|nr:MULTISPECIES: hypothetical protein [unclassified Streptomyces]MYW69904.1 hypothetical protein [Streptomyces sp. SID8379]